MRKELDQQLHKLIANYKEKRYLIAASGGLDSTVLIYLCHQLNLDFGICHVNFQLRGDDSDGDQNFLEKLAKDIQRPIYILQKNAKVYAKQHKLSTQEAARNIRYHWFEDCLTNEKYNYLLTAHHANDNLETYLLNSFRGTGLQGLTGIPVHRDYILRPLLKFNRSQLQAFAISEHIVWREDISNISDHYLRNIIRHHLIPFFEKNSKDMYASVNATFHNLNRQNALLKSFIYSAEKDIISQNKFTKRIDIAKLLTYSNHEFLLIEILNRYNFTDHKSIEKLITAQNGKYVESNTHKLVKERGFLELFEIVENNYNEMEFNLNKMPQKITFLDGFLSISEVETFEKVTNDIAFLDKKLLSTNLVLRKVKKSDFFYPLGMNGKRKLSDFLKDEKLTNFEKSKVWVLTSNQDIVWVVNYRIDNRYKITKTTHTCLKIKFSGY